MIYHHNSAGACKYMRNKKTLPNSTGLENEVSLARGQPYDSFLPYSRTLLDTKVLEEQHRTPDTPVKRAAVNSH